MALCHNYALSTWQSVGLTHFITNIKTELIMRLWTYQEIEDSEKVAPQKSETMPIGVEIIQHGNTPEIEYNILYSMDVAKQIEINGGIVRYY